MLREFVKRFFDLYDIRDLMTGGNCGLCGAWIPDEIFDKMWRWGMCDKCAKAKDED